MKLFINIMLLLLLPVVVSAQSQPKQLDSLHVALKNAANDTVRMDVYYQLGSFYNQINRDSALFYLDQSIRIAQKLKLTLNEARALEYKGFVLLDLGNYPKSLETLLQALKIAEDPASEKNAWIPPSVLSFTGRNLRNFRLDVLGYTQNSIGLLYGATGNTDKEIANYFTTISLAESIHDTLLLSAGYGNLGAHYFLLNKLDSSLLFTQRALRLTAYLPFEQRRNEGIGLLFDGFIYLRKGNFNLALDALLKSVQTSTEHYNLRNLWYGHSALSNFYQALKKPDSSLLYARKGLETAQSLGQPQYLADAYKLLSEVYSSQKNRDSTLKYLLLSTALHDSLNSEEKKNLLAYQNLGFDEQIRLQKLEEEKIQTQTKIRTYAMLAGLGVFLALGFILYLNNRQKQKANKILESTLTNLKSTQSQLIHSEKMASLGELTAGIAHEIQNPLNFVNNFSEVNKDLIEEVKSQKSKLTSEELDELLNEISDNEGKINHHGKRADSIVKGMLQHSKQTSGVKEPTDINALCDEYLRLSYHGMRAKDKNFNAEIKTDFDERIGKINIVPQDIGRVLLNLYNNALYAVNEKAKQQPNGYDPTISVSTKKTGDKVILTVKDNGNGVPQNIVDKIFQPFFTTKPTGQGTGLGLSLSYDTIKAHGGEIKVETKEGEGSRFIVSLSA